MIGQAKCVECGAEQREFEVPPEPRNPSQRRGVRNYIEDVRRAAARQHRKVTPCKSTTFVVSFVTQAPQLVAVARERRTV